MPTLLAFLPCRGVLVNQLDNSATLVSLLEEIQIHLPNLRDIPPHAAAPMEWYVFTLWTREPQDEGKTFEQRVALLDPDGAELLSAITKFEFPTVHHRIMANFMGFPIKMPGSFQIKLQLRENGDGDNWKEVSSFPLPVRHVPTASR